MLCQLEGILNQIVNATAKVGETFILGLPTLPSHVDLLDDHRQFEVGKDHIKMQGGEVATTLLCVDLHKSLAANESWRGRDSWQNRL